MMLLKIMQGKNQAIARVLHETFPVLKCFDDRLYFNSIRGKHQCKGTRPRPNTHNVPSFPAVGDLK